jgi:exodeoxyribonuclease-3
MAFARKQSFLMQLEPDLAVIPESGRDLDAPAGHWAWGGSDRNQGIGVVSYGDYHVALHPKHDSKLGSAIAVAVTGPHEFFLLAIWARVPYREPVYRALKKYRKQLTDGPAVVAGDFNSNKNWDKSTRPHNHGRNVAVLEEMGIFSAYHDFRGVAQGDETESTHYWRYRTQQDTIFHIDYCFVPEPWLSRITSVEIGKAHDWIENRRSDHVPLIVDITMKRDRPAATATN